MSRADLELCTVPRHVLNVLFLCVWGFFFKFLRLWCFVLAKCAGYLRVRPVDPYCRWMLWHKIEALWLLSQSSDVEIGAVVRKEDVTSDKAQSCARQSVCFFCFHQLIILTSQPDFYHKVHQSCCFCVLSLSAFTPEVMTELPFHAEKNRIWNLLENLTANITHVHVSHVHFQCLGWAQFKIVHRLKKINK